MKEEEVEEEELEGEEGTENAEELTQLNEEDHAKGLSVSQVNFYFSSWFINNLLYFPG